MKSMPYSGWTNEAYNSVFVTPEVFKSLFGISIDRVKWVGSMCTSHAFSMNSYINVTNQYLTLGSPSMEKSSSYDFIITIIHE